MDEVSVVDHISKSDFIWFIGVLFTIAFGAWAKNIRDAVKEFRRIAIILETLEKRFLALDLWASNHEDYIKIKRTILTGGIGHHEDIA